MKGYTNDELVSRNGKRIDRHILKFSHRDSAKTMFNIEKERITKAEIVIESSDREALLTGPHDGGHYELYAYVDKSYMMARLVAPKTPRAAMVDALLLVESVSV